MTTPLGLARQLRLAFPEFAEVRLVREGPWLLRGYCALSDPRSSVPVNRLEEWIKAHKMAHTQLSLEQVATIPVDLDDEEALLRRTRVRRVVAEEVHDTLGGLSRILRELFPWEVRGISQTNGLTVHVDPNVRPPLEEEILTTTRLLMSCDIPSLVITRERPPGVEVIHEQGESQATYSVLEEDRERLYDHLPDVLTADSFSLPALPAGSSTYASVHDGVASLRERLALFERVYMFMPLSIEDFREWAGCTIDEFLDVLPTGRVVPVFGLAAERYEAGLMSRILEVAPRAILHGEHALRAARSFRDEHPALAFITSESGVELRLGVRSSSDPQIAFIRAYLDALTDIASRLPQITITGQAFGIALYPLAQWLDEALARFGVPSRDLDIVTALEHRAVTKSVGGVPLSRVGHYLDSHLRLVCGAYPGESELIRIPDPHMIGRICFPDVTGTSLREFAESFRGPAVDAMRELMRSERVQTADGAADLVKQFNDELKVYARRIDNLAATTATVLTVAGIVGVLGAPAAIATLGLELARRILGRKAPGALATLTSGVTGTTREAALLARIKKAS